MKQLLSILIFISSFSLLNAQTPTQCNNVVITNITTTTFKATWNSGNGNNVIVVVKPASSPLIIPSSASMASYVASTAYGSGTNLGSNNYVIYKASTTNSVNITNLNPNTDYDVFVYSYNFSVLLGVYTLNTSTSGNNAGHYTLALQPTSIPSISLNGTPTSTSAPLIFSGSATNNLVFVYQSGVGAPTNPVDGVYYNPSTIYGNGNQIGGFGTGNYAVYSNTSNNSINVTNLTPATAYYAIVQAYNGTGSVFNNSNNYYNLGDNIYFETFNNAPTLNSISNYTVCQAAAATTVILTGLTDGSASETQNIVVTASSSNTALIPNPTINYNNPFTTATLLFQPNVGQSGTAVITVTVDDGPLANSVTTKTFTVTVLPIPAAAGIISTANTTICQVKNGVVFTVPAIPNATIYNWNLPPNATVTAGANTNSITVNFNISSTSFNVGVFGSNANGCGNGSPSFLLVNFDKVPTPSNAGPNQQICNNLTALAANVPSVGNGAWTFCSTGLGNVSSTTAANANLQVINNSTVTSVWTVTNGVCPASSSTVIVANINGSPSCNPDADFLSNNTTVCLGAPVTFTSTSVGALSYTYSFGASATPSVANTANVLVTYSTPGAKSVTLTINSLSGLNTEIKTAYINVITVPTAPVLITGNQTVCQDKAAEPYFINVVANTTGYNWSFPSGVTQNTGGNTNVISANFSTTAASGNIGVTAVNGCGFSPVTTLSITVSPLPTVASTITGSNTVCQGVNGAVYIANNLNNALSFTWALPNGVNIISGLNTKTITVNFDNTAVSGTVSVYGTNGCGDGTDRNKPIVVNPLPGAAGFITGSSSNNICPLSTNINYSLTPVSNATGYSWFYPSGYTAVSGGNTNSIILNASVNATNGKINVVGTNACGSGDTSLAFQVNINAIANQQLCVVTVDSLSLHNEIFWQKNGVSNVDSFRVYRVKSAMLDTLIGTVEYLGLGRLVDLTANPKVTSYTYKISAVDPCGNEGPKSAQHQSIHLQSIYSTNPQKVDLSWNLYVGAAVNNYRVLRDTNNSGNWLVLAANLAPNATSYTDFGIPTGATSVQYRVDVVWLNSCNPSQKIAQSIVNTTKSNTKDFLIIAGSNSIKSQNDFLNAISLYPNPTENSFNINLKAGVETFDVEVYNQLGSKLISNHFSYSDTASIDVAELSSGIYFVVVKTQMGSVTKKLTKL